MTDIPPRRGLSRRSFLKQTLATGMLGLEAGAARERFTTALAGGFVLSHDTIVSYAIHPAIGIARVGNSKDKYFVAPQVPGAVPDPPYKDDAGAVKRQAAMFRIYGLNAQGQAVREITADDADIEWRVHVANRKAGWYQFKNAMDLGPHSIPECGFRNRFFSGAARRQLIIDPGARKISGRNQSGPTFDTGEFKTVKVYLGELRTDEQGRLLVLGGRGHSASVPNTPATTFANNDGWHDDVSDGPVRATVRIGGRAFEAEPAMVVVAPPNFGQGLYPVVTMYDVAVDLFLRELHWLQPPKRVSFWQDIYPIFDRLVQCQWVNQGFYLLFGKNSPSDLTAPELLAQLSDPSPQNMKERQRLFYWFRDPDATMAEPVKLPPFYGDTHSDFPGRALASDRLAVTRTQYHRLQQWANGDFYNDPAERTVSPRPLEQLPVAEQPHALDQAALEECLGGPFHPGIEMTWVMRRASMWKAPFRLKILPENANVKDDYGPILRPQACLGPDGPLQASGPGTLTRWMGLPWQTDEASCLASSDTSTYLPLPSFWAVRVPNDILSEGAYQRAMDERLPHAQRLKHFDHRQFWLRDLGVSYQRRINDMVASWDQVGIVSAFPGPAAESDLPARIWVEAQRSKRFSKPDSTWQQVLIAERQIEALEAEPSVSPYQRRHSYRRDEL